MLTPTQKTHWGMHNSDFDYGTDGCKTDGWMDEQTKMERKISLNPWGLSKIYQGCKNGCLQPFVGRVVKVNLTRPKLPSREFQISLERCICQTDLSCLLTSVLWMDSGLVTSSTMIVNTEMQGWHVVVEHSMSPFFFKHYFQFVPCSFKHNGTAFQNISMFVASRHLTLLTRCDFFFFLSSWLGPIMLSHLVEMHFKAKLLS